MVFLLDDDEMDCLIYRFNSALDIICTVDLTFAILLNDLKLYLIDVHQWFPLYCLLINYNSTVMSLFRIPDVYHAMWIMQRHLTARLPKFHNFNIHALYLLQSDTAIAKDDLNFISI